jgi:hypothetical protein
MGGDIEGCGFQVVGNSVLDNDDDGLCSVWKKSENEIAKSDYTKSNYAQRGLAQITW